MLQKLHKNGFIHLFSGNFIVFVLSFIQQLLLAYFLTASDFGLLKLMMTYVFIGNFIAVFGLHVALAYYVARYRVSSSKFYSAALLFSTSVSVVAFMSLYVLNFFDLILSEQKHLFYWYLIILFAEPLLMLTNSYLQALQEYKLFSKIYLSLRLCLLILTVCFVYFYGLKGFIVAIIGYSILVLLTLYFILLKKIIIKLYLSHLYILLQYAKYSFFTSLFGYLTLYADLLILNFYKVSLAHLGAFSFMQIFAVGLKQFSSIIGQFYLPKLTKATFNNRLLIMKKFQFFNFLATFIIFSISLLLIPYFIEFFFAKYKVHMDIFYLLFVAGLFNSLITPYGIFFVSIGDPTINFYNSIIVLFINLVLCMVLISIYGLHGAAFATMISFLIGAIYFFIRYKKELWSNA